MSERVEAARDAFYQARWEQKKSLDSLRFGVEWADANPQPRTITLAQSEAILEAGRAGRYEDHEAALRAAGIEVDDAFDVPTTCAACGKPAEGFAMINGERFCHPDEGPSCYMGGQA